ncbi:hypothetical protein [Hydrogenophaga sp.]|uniref:hypothetical protein n=1 Tax=Hydrogenophaga sp. TaxID=1904254 RepID=UPI002FC5B31E
MSRLFRLARLGPPLLVFFTLLPLSFHAAACPIGMLYNGNGCSPPYERNMDDWIRERHDYLESLGPRNRAPVRSMTAEEVANLKRLQAEKDQRDLKIAQELAQGVWFSASNPTPDGKLCVATFAKATREDNGQSAGMVSILGFQKPKPDAWLIFYGTGLPTPRNVEKIRITLQQDDEPAQTVQVFSYRHEGRIGTVAFAVPGLAAALEGMRDRQSFKLSIDGKTAMAITWTGAAPVMAQLRQCAQ